MQLGVVVVCALAVSLAWAPRAGAEPPTGGYTIPIDGESGLIVPTGEAEVCQAGVCVSTDVTTDSDGVVSGSGLIEVDTDITASVDLELAGRVSGTTEKPKLVLVFLASGDAKGVDLEGKGKLKCTLPEGALGLLDCVGKLKVCAFELGQKLGCEKLPFATQVAFARQAFALNLDLQTILNKTVTGEASAQIGAVTIASYLVKGKYKSADDVATLALKGTDPELKTKAVLKGVQLAAGGASAGTAIFKVMGQKGRVELPQSAPAAASCSRCGTGEQNPAILPFLPPQGMVPEVPRLDPFAPLPF